MNNIQNNQLVKAEIELSSGVLNIDFADEPGFALSETVIVDLMRRSIGVIFHHIYHHIGDLPSALSSDEVEKATRACLSGHGEYGRKITLHAPVKLVERH